MSRLVAWFTALASDALAIAPAASRLETCTGCHSEYNGVAAIVNAARSEPLASGSWLPRSVGGCLALHQPAGAPYSSAHKRNMTSYRFTTCQNGRNVAGGVESSACYRWQLREARTTRLERRRTHLCLSSRGHFMTTRKRWRQVRPNTAAGRTCVRNSESSGAVCSSKSDRSEAFTYQTVRFPRSAGLCCCFRVPLLACRATDEACC